MKNKQVIAFLSGIIVGTTLGTWIDEDEKKKIKKMLGEQAEEAKNKYQRPIKERLAKLRQLVRATQNWWKEVNS